MSEMSQLRISFTQAWIKEVNLVTENGFVYIFDPGKGKWLAIHISN